MLLRVSGSRCYTILVDLVSCLTVFIDGASRSEAILGGRYLSRRAVVFTPDKPRLCQHVDGAVQPNWSIGGAMSSRLRQWQKAALT